MSFQTVSAFDDTVFDTSTVEDLDLEVSGKKKKKKPARKMVVEPDLVSAQELPVVDQLTTPPEDDLTPIVLPESPFVEAQPVQQQRKDFVLGEEEDVGTTDDLEIVQTDQMNWDLTPLTGVEMAPPPTITPVQPELITEPSLPLPIFEPVPPMVAPTFPEPVMIAQFMPEEDITSLMKQGPYVSVQLSDLTTAEAIKAVAFAAGEKVVIPEDIPGQVTLDVDDKPWMWVVNSILKSRPYKWDYKDDILVVYEDTLKAKGPVLQQKFTLKYAVPSHTGKKIKHFLSETGGYIANDDYGFLIVSDVAPVLNVVARLIQATDLTPQKVVIDAKFVDVDDEVTSALGLSWKIPHGDNQTFNPQTVAGRFGLTGTDTTLDDLLKYLEESRRAKVLAAPKVVTLNNKSTMVGRSETLLSFNKVQRKIDTDTFLSIEPRIINNDWIELSIYVNREYLNDGNKRKKDQKVEKHRAKTTLLVKKGETAVISGIQDSNIENQENKVPSRNMVIFITPHFEMASRIRP